jgi:hypothetical protein
MVTTVKQAIIRVVASKLREYYLRGIRDARIELREGSMPSFLEGFDAGDFEQAHDKHVWIKIAADILDC